MTTAALLRLRLGDYVPQFDHARAVSAITSAGSFTELEMAWFSIALDYEMSEREVEPEIHEAYQWQKAMLTDVQAIVTAGPPR